MWTYFYICEVKIEIWSVENKIDVVSVYETPEGSLNGTVAVQGMVHSVTV